MRRSPSPRPSPRTPSTQSARTHAAALITALTLALPGAAQPGPACAEDEAIPPWLGMATSTLADGTAQGTAEETLTLCAQGPGFGPDFDHARLLAQGAQGDFTLEASLASVEVGGRAGLAAYPPGRTKLTAPRAAIIVEAKTDGTVEARASVRTANGAAAFEGETPLDVTLPVTLRLERVGGVLAMKIVQTASTSTLLEQDVAGSELGSALQVGMHAASGDETSYRTATFRDATLDVTQLPPAPGCLEAASLVPGEEATVLGRHLDGVTAVWVGGEAAQVVSQSSRSLTFVVPGLEVGAPLDVSLEGTGALATSLVGVQTAGRPFVRGDVDDDGVVDRSDWNEICYAVHRGKDLDCLSTADIDADGDIDDDDLVRLRRFLELGEAISAPSGPFPDAGFAAGGAACGQSPLPTGLRFEDQDGEPLGPGPFSQGDVVVLRGYRLPDAERLVAFLGEVALDVLELGGTDLAPEERRYRLVIGRVAQAGQRCLRFIDAAPTDRGARFGEGFVANQGSSLCVELAASVTGGLASNEEEGTIELSWPRDVYAPGATVDVEVGLLLPAVQKVTRGARAARFSMTLPLSYELGLYELSHKLKLAVQGHDDEDCACEVAVVPDPVGEKVLLAPCLPPPPPPPPPPGPIVPTPNSVTKPKTLVGGVQVLPKDLTDPVDCSVEHNPDTDPRAYAWCLFQSVTETVTDHEYAPYNGEPRWMTFRPLRSKMPGPDVWWVVEPSLQSLADRTIMLDYGAEHRLDDMDYFDPCAVAVRSQRCDGFESNWMPRVKSDDLVIKNFWMPLSRLPASLDETQLYSWDPVDAERQYLVGMHIAPARDLPFGNANSYFRWITYWVPAPPGETTTKGGQPLSSVYSPHCTVGTGFDRPLELTGPWSRYVMCTDSAQDETACGNPWAPGECPAQGSASCTWCHANASVSVQPNGWGTDKSVELGWLPSIAMGIQAEINACVAGSEANLLATHGWWLSPTHEGTTEPLRCDRSDPGVVEPFP